MRPVATAAPVDALDAIGIAVEALTDAKNHLTSGAEWLDQESRLTSDVAALRDAANRVELAINRIVGGKS